ncbi:oxidoreductase [Sphingomonas sp. BT-65]|uniref:oxidoreductase n=1 Tax=Sphingomonas sp. BT-65 TaxID=2989821 RepID=UPI0022355D24|nr:oxidoreductase [Sphingomonas sp. BT-65]MCW4461257.1 oxidoreductase [Sphingomonas sp. BT-65]
MARTWFITGASSGFGRALAEAALARGDSAVLAARRGDALRALAEGHGERALPVTLDVTDETSRRAAIAAALDRFGRVDVLANIAGRGSLGAAEEFAPDQLRDQMEVNFFGPVELTRALLPAMRGQRSGHILNLTSIGGLISMGGFSVYCASKFALEGWSEALRDEVRPLGIHVTIVEPGAFRTEFAGDANMRPVERLDAYRGVIDPIEAYLYGGDGEQPGDPARAAAAMIAVVESDDPPLRLMLGADALAGWEAKRAVVDTDVAAWRAVGEATAFPDAEIRPIGGREG